MRIIISYFRVYNLGLKNSPATVKGRFILYEIPSKKVKGVEKVEKRSEFNFRYSGIFQSSDKKENVEVSLQQFCSKAANDPELAKNLLRSLPQKINIK